MAAQRRQAQDFGNDALAGKGRVAMQQERHDLGALFKRHHFFARAAKELVLLGARLAHDDRVYDFEMRGVGRQRQVHLVVVELAVRRRAKVIFDVARTFDIIRRIGAALEFVEDGAVRLHHHVGQDVEAAAMGHAEHDFLQAERPAALDDLLKCGDQRFTAVETKTLGALVFDVDKLLEAFGLDQLVQDRLLAIGGKFDRLVWPFDALLNPCLLLGVRDVHELDAERRAIGALEDVEHLADRGVVAKTQHLVDEDRPVIVGFGKAVIFRRQLVIVFLLGGDAERVEIGVQMAAHAIGADHHDGAHGIARGAFDRFARDWLASGGRLVLQLLVDDLFDLAPIAVERRDEFAIGLLWPALGLPGCALRIFGDVGCVVLQAGEEVAPFLVDRGWVLLPVGIELLDVVGIAAIEERGDLERVVGLVVACHL